MTEAPLQTGGRRLLLVLPMVTLGLLSTVFLGMNWQGGAGIDWWFLTFVSLSPWIIFTVRTPHRKAAYSVSYFLGVAFFLINTYYIWYITKAGYIALGFYFGLFYLLFALVLRPAYLRLRLPLTLLVPLLWVACEYARGVGPLAFPLLLLAHGVYRRLPLIQISDLMGAYSVSFILAMINGLIADVILAWMQRRNDDGVRSRLFGPVLATLLVTASVLLYGVVQLNRDTISLGPVIAVLQGDYPLSVNPEDPRPREQDKAVRYLELLTQAAAHTPDLFLLPETPWAMTLNDEFLEAGTFPVNAPFYEDTQKWSRSFDQTFRNLAGSLDSCIVVGAGSIEFPPGHYPKTRKFNSAFVYHPHVRQKQRYDKLVLVLFGEYTPFRSGRFGLHAVYRWLDSFNPFSSPDDEFSLTPGAGFSVFEMKDSRGQSFRFAVPICFEDLIPRVGREFARDSSARAGADFLLSISNDGWFNHGALVPQHLAVCAFRAVENRVGIARSVNTSCSGFVDPDGRIRDVVSKDGRTLGSGIFGYEVAQVKVDSRRSLYTRYGDWFAAVCGCIGAGLLMIFRLTRWGVQS